VFHFGLVLPDGNLGDFVSRSIRPCIVYCLLHFIIVFIVAFSRFCAVDDCPPCEWIHQQQQQHATAVKVCRRL
jgi:hypothetical protein